ncbi:hypothetical protein GCM10025774_35900 [Microbacterium kyungheense]|uniref:Acetyltransferase (GNAT) family protein n=1 Tax=Microbacterium kyungheense TaxID=1263636 RepID=A0A543ERT9_9MICO|nr:acetyltransferase (GNAT) family protein [Microbacterium kyungheense]
MARVRGILLRLSDITTADVDNWTALAERATEPNAALDPRFLLPDRKISGNHLLVVAEEDGKWLGLVRVFPVDLAPTLPLRTYGTLEPADLGPPFPLLDPARASDALAAIARTVRRRLRRGYIGLRGYPASGPLAQALQDVSRRPALHATVVASHIVPWVDVLPARAAPHERVHPAVTDPEYRSASTRKELRRYARRLVEAGGGPLTLHDASDDPEAIDRFVTMQASGWKGDREHGGYAVALDRERETAFRAKTEAFRESGDLIVLEMWAGDAHVYSHLYVVSGGVAMGILDAYQHEYGAYSTGKLGRTAVTTHMRGLQRLKALNPGHFYYGDDEAVKAFPDRREFVDVVIGVGIVPSLLCRLLPRTEASLRARAAVMAFSRGDALMMRAIGTLTRKPRPTP